MTELQRCWGTRFAYQWAAWNCINSSVTRSLVDLQIAQKNPFTQWQRIDIDHPVGNESNCLAWRARLSSGIMLTKRTFHRIFEWNLRANRIEKFKRQLDKYTPLSMGISVFTIDGTCSRGLYFSRSELSLVLFIFAIFNPVYERRES